jgi:hypothetical protein
MKLRLFLATLATTTVGTGYTLHVTAQEDGKPLVLIERVVNAKYKEDTATYAALLSSSMTKPYIVKDGDSLSEIVSTRYKIGQRQTPELYEPMADRIRSLNSIEEGKHLVIGQNLDLPDMPPLQWKEPATSNPKFGVPRVQRGPSYEAAKSGDISKSWESIHKMANFNIKNMVLKAEPLVSQPRWTSPEVAKAELQSSGGAVRTVLWDQPLTIGLADGGIQLAGTSIPEDVKFVQALVKRRPPPNEAVLFVLDDAWPDSESFTESKAFMLAAMDLVRKKYKLGDGLEIGKLKDASSSTFRENYPSHSLAIKAALADFHAVTNKVRVIYLPLFTEQKWSRELWLEMLFLVRCAFMMDTQFGLMQPNSFVRTEAEKFAKEVIGQIPQKAVNDVGRAQQSPINTLHSLAQLYAQATGVPYFVNMSWTVKKKQLEFKPNSDADIAGVSLAAAGNDKLDVMIDTVYLAYRAKASPGDVIAVMNTDDAGAPMCNSSMLPLSSTNAFYGFAYDGRVQSTGACATSFSTPRVAWLLALRHAYNAPMNEAAGWAAWYSNFQQSVTALQGGQGLTTAKRYWLPVTKLFAGL